MKKIILVILFIFVLIYGYQLIRKITKEQVPANVEAHVRINDHLWYCEVANTASERMQGLSERKKLSQNACMVFIMEEKKIHEFWMKDMLFNLDMIWVDETKIVDITKEAKIGKKGEEVPRYSAVKASNVVIEINAKQSEKYGIKEGQNVSIDFF